VVERDSLNICHPHHLCCPALHILYYQGKDGKGISRGQVLLFFFPHLSPLLSRAPTPIYPSLHKCRNFIPFCPDIVVSCSLQTVAVDNTAEGDSVRKTKRQIVIHHTDIIGDVFWNAHPEILGS